MYKNKLSYIQFHEIGEAWIIYVLAIFAITFCSGKHFGNQGHRVRMFLTMNRYLTKRLSNYFPKRKVISEESGLYLNRTYISWNNSVS